MLSAPPSGNPSPGGNAGVCGVNPADFSQIKGHLQKQSFNNTRLTMCKQILRDKGPCFSVPQIKELVLLFSFEQTRLELAQYAYDFTNDPSNFYLVSDVFTFSSTKEDFMEFLEGKK
jgi:hypothetical protein